MPVTEQRDLSFKADDRIFHYTNAKGLYGILESKCLWATHFRFLNDRKELSAARDALIEFTTQRLHPRIAAWKVNGKIEPVEGETTKSAAENEAKNFVDQFYETSYEHLGESYIFSGFCCDPSHISYRDGGLLHWATYGRHGGYAVQINPHKLQSLIENETKRIEGCSIAFSKVVYSIGELRKNLDEEFSTFADVAIQFVEERFLRRTRQADLFRAAMPFQQITTALKDHFFEGEEEARIMVWRLVSETLKGRNHPVKMRHSEGLSIPYIELFCERLFEPINPVEAIIIGPHPEKELRKTALKTYLRSASLDGVDVRVSNAPYVG